MDMQETLRIGKKLHPAASQHFDLEPRVNNVPYREIVGLLHQADIPVNLATSEVAFSYETITDRDTDGLPAMGRREATAPITTKFLPSSVEIIGYDLRNQFFHVRLRNYEDEPTYSEGKFGPPREEARLTSIESGIEAKFYYFSGNAREGGELIEKAKKVIQELFSEKVAAAN